MAARPECLNEAALVWTAENRSRYDRRDQRYPSDLTNEEWVLLEPMLPVAKGSGRPRKYVLREVMNGIRYVQRYGIPWDAMPKDLPPGSICYDYWRLLTDDGHMERLNHDLVMADREKAGREASPTLAIVDAQSVKCDAPQGERGYDAGKKVLGRKRHIAVDIDGRLLAVDVTTADVQDQDGGIPLAQRLVRLCPWIKTVVVDGGYKNRFIEAVQAKAGRVVQVVKRPEFSKGFVLLPKRWRVEQSIGALTISRRLKVDYDTLIHVSAAAMLFASITRLMASITMR
ncbi:IS5 family transposase [Magnetospirillum gryphiswaldense]|uniref:IS4 family transposase n=1 Tax=Magnetospirillum gryphiswaldense TaxID=55518 RepID=A4U1U5_9PROT|nr:IS5 family transposase [Magnetospirillum gryphiswaldense]AVM72901.1 Transposase DDE domain protein [Magnetospirillum gryphiswaldense MSR-1]AVM72920.1 Transposase DDE domain protein [Magnetospirillum gryphiswaldense MSR-1]AVM76093.1 Transposase DDE domain protein [Magnetospirillum gryphiswaldense MSR-1]AVM76804.1 Transposase DDE domain protein [Magnetospirillum gryphiswaldense]AVM76823.1 Transposase DDE domain protein [Magnetospirillum gryphiswaldense]